MSFRDFMEKALYYPTKGYYTSGKERIGVKGDYYTSPFLSPIFAAMIGRQLEEMWINMGSREFTVVECGAGTGLLAMDVISYIKRNPAFYEKLIYKIVEKNQMPSSTLLEKYGNKVSWHTDVSEIDDFEGCIFSNEMIDNFPVHRVVMKKELQEIFVDHQDGFIEFLKPANQALLQYINEFDISLSEGYYTEINLEAAKWIEDVSQKLLRGYLITIDYGFETAVLYDNHHRDGTLICYHNHQINNQPYDAIGEQDITSHVNFSALKKWGLNKNLEYCGLVNQAQFLLALGFKEYFLQEYGNVSNIQQAAELEMRLNQVLLLEMGEKFKVLIQKKGLVDGNLRGIKSGLTENGQN